MSDPGGGATTGFLRQQQEQQRKTWVVKVNRRRSLYIKNFLTIYIYVCLFFKRVRDKNLSKNFKFVSVVDFLVGVWMEGWGD